MLKQQYIFIVWVYMQELCCAVSFKEGHYQRDKGNVKNEEQKFPFMQNIPQLGTGNRCLPVPFDETNNFYKNV